MLRFAIGAMLGGTLATALCWAILAWSMPEPEESMKSWPTYPTLANAGNFGVSFVDLLELRRASVVGYRSDILLLAGGFGALLGAMAGATSAVLAAIRKRPTSSP
jgi:hypothetical protein